MPEPSRTDREREHTEREHRTFRWDRGHEWEFGAFGGGWAAFTCLRCGGSSLDFFTKWRRCRPYTERQEPPK